jgi:four helix bundle protein
MAKIERVEDIVAWKKSVELCSLIKATALNESFSKDFALKNQIRRSAFSVHSNIDEEYKLGTNKQFVNFLFIAKSSCGEIRTQHYIAKNLNNTDEEKFEELSQNHLRLVERFQN